MSELVAQLLRASTPGVCHTERHSTSSGLYPIIIINIVYRELYQFTNHGTDQFTDLSYSVYQYNYYCYYR